MSKTDKDKHQVYCVVRTDNRALGVRNDVNHTESPNLASIG